MGCERAAVAGALWWLVAGAVGRTVDGRLAVRCPDGTVRHVTVDYLRTHPTCQVRMRRVAVMTETDGQPRLVDKRRKG